jgi:NitT/TauT family transport system substrate-binding protein
MKGHDKCAVVDPIIASDVSQGVRRCRRQFVARVSALVGCVGLLAYDMRRAAAEPPPETSAIRLVHAPTICLAPQYVAEELLRAEGFTHIEYTTPEGTATIADEMAAGRIDIGQKTAAYVVPVLDAGVPIVVLAGIHAGCYELFGNDKVRNVGDLRGKSVAISAFGTSEHIFLSSMVAYVGIDPRKEINWIFGKTLPATMQIFVEGKADAFLAFAPQPQELRARKIGHVIVDTTHDRPWAQYFCCVLTANREFTTKYPMATKRALRAILKAAEICVQEPERAARYPVMKGYESRYETALEILKTIPYERWRSADPEDTLRFHALRLHEAGMIKSTPQKIIAQGTDWHFLNELKRELKV